MSTKANAASIKKAHVLSPLRKKQLLFGAGYIGLFLLADLLTHGTFFGRTNLISAVTHAVYYGVVGFGMVFIMTGGIIDMSIGATVLLSGNIGALLATSFGMGYPGLILGTMLSAALLEGFTVLVGLKLKIPSWIAGLGMTLLYEGILTLYSNHLSATQGIASIQLDGFNYFGQIPGIIFVWLIAFVLCYFLYNRTTVGMNIRALGCNPDVAQEMGVKREKTLLIGAVIGGLFIGAGAMAYISLNKRLTPAAGMNSISQIFKSLATFLLAQSFASIIGVPMGILLGSLLIAALFNFMTLMGVPSGTGQEIMLGAIVVLCGIISKLNYKGVMK